MYPEPSFWIAPNWEQIRKMTVMLQFADMTPQFFIMFFSCQL